MLDELRFHLLRAQQVMKASADTHRKELQFQVGEQAYLKIQPYRQKSLATRPYEKLASRFYGPFTVLERIGQVAYKLDLPATSRIHPVVHVSQLKKMVGKAPVSPTLPPQLSSDLEMIVEPEALLDLRSRVVGDTAHT